ncbi:zinc finger protein 728-like [Agrilus planipennis]|nr:zinc finger protein 728-like [Agrilus planipennis]
MVKHLEKNHLNERCFRCTSCPKNSFTFEELQNHFKSFHRKSSVLQMTYTKSFNSDSTDTGDYLVVANASTPSEKEETVDRSSDQNKIDSAVIQHLLENKTTKGNHFETQNNLSANLTGSNSKAMSSNTNNNYHFKYHDGNTAEESPDSSNINGNSNNIETNSFGEMIENDSDKAICAFCEMKFKHPLLLKNHLKSTHNKKGPFKCAICPKEYSGYQGLDGHFAMQHTGKKFKCYQCKQGFDSKEEVAYHRKAHHRNYCDICQTYYAVTPYCHNKDVHAEDKIKCTICDKTYNGKRRLRIHIRRVHPRTKYPCSVCGKKFKRNAVLNEHYTRKHTEIKTTVCQECGKEINANYLRAHLKAHRRMLFCKICKKSYKTYRAVQYCEDKHNNIRRYKCTMCDKSYFSPGSLIIHRRLHTGEKPYSCSVCSRSFYTVQILYKHSLSHKRVK